MVLYHVVMSSYHVENSLPRGKLYFHVLKCYYHVENINSTCQLEVWIRVTCVKSIFHVVITVATGVKYKFHVVIHGRCKIYFHVHVVEGSFGFTHGNGRIFHVNVPRVKRVTRVILGGGYLTFPYIYHFSPRLAWLSRTVSYNLWWGTGAVASPTEGESHCY
jgi:hypothetical protein